MSAGFFAEMNQASGSSVRSRESSAVERRSILFMITKLAPPPAPISESTCLVTSSWLDQLGSEASITCSRSDASAASSSVDLKLAIKSCGSFLMKPTVSLTRIRG